MMGPNAGERAAVGHLMKMPARDALDANGEERATETEPFFATKRAPLLHEGALRSRTSARARRS